MLHRWVGALVGLALFGIVAGFSGSSLAHPVEYIFDDNLDNTFTFSAMTINHGSPATVGSTGILINGVDVSFDNEFAITDAAWDALLADADAEGAASAFGFDIFVAAFVLDITLDLLTIDALGLIVGEPFTFNTFDNSSRWLFDTGNTVTLTFASAVAVPNPPPSPSSSSA